MTAPPAAAGLIPASSISLSRLSKRPLRIGILRAVQIGAVLGLCGVGLYYFVVKPRIKAAGQTPAPIPFSAAATALREKKPSAENLILKPVFSKFSLAKGAPKNSTAAPPALSSPTAQALQTISTGSAADFCAVDIEKFCGKSAQNEAALDACLRAHVLRLSGTCKDVAKREIQKDIETMQAACYSEIGVLCGRLGFAKTLRCLKNHEDALANLCLDSLKPWEADSGDDSLPAAP